MDFRRSAKLLQLCYKPAFATIKIKSRVLRFKSLWAFCIHLSKSQKLHLRY